MPWSEIHDDRLRRFRDAGLYLVTSQSISAGRTTLEIVKSALAGGVRLIQLREKDLSARELVELAGAVRRLTLEARALLLINDRVDVALTVHADGVHLGQDDLPISEARRLAPDLIIGGSAHSVEEAVRAERDGASYVNIGPLFPTQTKKWTGEYLGVEAVRDISRYISIPFTVMGGIKKEHIPALVAAGAHTFGVVTAVTQAPDPTAACQELLAEIRRPHAARGA